MTKTAVLLIAAGALTFVGGIALLSVSAAVIVAGVLLIVAGVLNIDRTPAESPS